MKRNNIKNLLRQIRNTRGKKPDWYLYEGDKVTVDVDRIMSRKEFKNLQPEYQQFIKNVRGAVFTTHIHRRRNDGFATLIELVEAPEWLFVESDLIKI